MNKADLSGLIKMVRFGIQKHSPEILTGIGIAGMITATVLAVRATPKAVLLLEEKKKEDDGRELRALDYVQATWKCYIPATVTGGLSVACLIGASSVNLRRNAALATAYSLSESALKGYQEKVIETIGEKKEKSIRDAVANDIIVENPVSGSEIVLTDKGETLCYDVISGRYFKSDIEKIKRTVNELNHRMMNEMYISLNDFYYEIGLPSLMIGEDLGWNVNDDLIDVWFSTQLAEDNTPCLVINYRIVPRYDYRRLL